MPQTCKQGKHQSNQSNEINRHSGNGPAKEDTNRNTSYRPLGPVDQEST